MLDKKTLRQAGISQIAYQALIDTQGQQGADQVVKTIASKKNAGTKSSYMTNTVNLLDDGSLKNSEGTTSKYKVLDETKAIEIKEAEAEVLAKMKSLLGTYRVNRMLFDADKKHKKVYDFWHSFKSKVDALNDEINQLND